MAAPEDRDTDVPEIPSKAQFYLQKYTQNVGSVNKNMTLVKKKQKHSDWSHHKLAWLTEYRYTVYQLQYIM